MKEIAYNQYAKETLEILSKGALLTVKSGEKVNAMTIGWGSIGFMWGKPVFMAMVRPSRLPMICWRAPMNLRLPFPAAMPEKPLEFAALNLAGKWTNCQEPACLPCLRKRWTHPF